MPDLHLDCSYGLGGDMFLAALSGLGVELGPLERMLRDAGVDVRVRVRPLTRHAAPGHMLVVEPGKIQPLRHLPNILKIIARLDVGADVRAASVAAFNRLGHAEAQVHEVDISEIHFHEVGAVDTLVDVVGALWGLGQLAIRTVTSTALPWFSGTVTCSHGTLDLPAPATRALLTGKPTYKTDFIQEIITPTGALILDQIVDQFDVPPPENPTRTAISYGAHTTGGGLRVALV